MNVVHEDRWLIVVDKPVGMPTQRTTGGTDGVYEILRRTERYVGMHHRLDQPVSGLVLFTRDKSANRGIASAMSRHAIQRSYRAVLWGAATATTWTSPVDGKRATTHARVIGQAAGLTAAELQLETGRKHQIRVQAAMAGTPVVGDRRYGEEAARRWPRIALHASRLRFTHPMTGDTLDIHAPIPPDLQQLWAEAGG